MATELFTSMRRFAMHRTGTVLTLLLGCVCLGGEAAAQTPSVVSSSVAALPHTGTYGSLWQSAISSRGDFVVFDFSNVAIYQFPANGAPAITVSAPGKLSGGGTFTDSGIAIDPRTNNLYVNNNFNGGLVEFPYDAATGTWDKPSVVVASGLSGNLGGSCGNYFQSAGMAINANGVLAVGTENGCGVEIFTVPIDASGTFGSATPVIANLQGRARDIAIDNAGNISFDEDSGANGAFFLPAGTTGLSGDSKGTIEATLVRVDPNLSNVKGVSVDATGNVYVSDASAGVYLVPLTAGVPTPASAELLTPATAQGNAVPALTGAILYEPVQGVTGISDVGKVYLNGANFGPVAVGSSSATPGTIYYAFNASLTTQITPNNYVLLENGIPAKDFVITGGGSCDIAGATAYPYQAKVTTGTGSSATTATVTTNSCTLNVNFTPSKLGLITANLLMRDANNKILATTVLQGIGQASAASVSPAAPATALESGLQTPGQVTTDGAGNLYVADAGLGKVLMYGPAAGGSATGVSLGSFKSPTGVAVDGAGDLFVADSGNVTELPFVYPQYEPAVPATNPPSQMLVPGTGALNTATPVTVATGLGANLRLAADGLGNIYVADPANSRVVEISNGGGTIGILGPMQNVISGFTAPSAVAVDASNNLYVADGANLIEVGVGNVLTTLANSLNGATGIAVDPAGDLYVAQPNSILLIPNAGGAFNLANAITLNTAVAVPAGLALDSALNVYVLDAAAKSVDLIRPNGALNFGVLPSVTATNSLNANVLDTGNVALNVSTFTSSNAVDYTETATTCTSPVNPGSACTATITLNPGAGEQGTLTGTISVASDAANGPESVSLTGVGAALLPSVSTITVGKGAGTGIPVTVSVAPASGSGVPTGNVTVTVVGTTSPTQPPLTAALSNGTASFTLTYVAAGTETFKVSYNGDRVYGRSTATAAGTVTAAATSLATPTPPAYVLSSGTGSAEPYNIASTSYTNYVVQVGNGVNIPTGTVTFWEGNNLVCDVTSAPGLDPAVAAGKVKPVTPDPYYNQQTGGKYANLSNATVALDANGFATFATNCLDVNVNNNTTSPNEIYTHTIVAVYNGDGVNAGSISSAFKITVLRGPSIAITSNPPTVSLSAGSTATAALTLTSVLGYGTQGAGQQLNNYSLPVELECDGLPARASCSFSSNSVTVMPGTPGTVTLTINTNVGASASLERSTSPIAFAALFGAGLLGLAFGRRKSGWRQRLTLMTGLLVLSGAVAGMTSCTSANLTSAPVLTTPSGMYQVTVTAKQVGSATVPGSTPGSTQPVYGNQNQVSLPFTMNVTIQ